MSGSYNQQTKNGTTFGVLSSKYGGNFSYTSLTGSYTAVATNCNISVTTSAASGSIVLCAASSMWSGQKFIIKDISGSSSTNNILISASGNDKIEGLSSVSITSNYGMYHLFSDGSKNFLIESQLPVGGGGGTVSVPQWTSCETFDFNASSFGSGGQGRVLWVLLRGGITIGNGNGIGGVQIKTTSASGYVNLTITTPKNAVSSGGYSIDLRNSSFSTLLYLVDAISSDIDFFIGVGNMTVDSSHIDFTSQSYGFQISSVASTVTTYATCANGSSQTNVSFSNLSITTDYSLNAIKTSTTNIKYYKDGTLLTTITTNLPTSLAGNLGTMCLSNKNTAASTTQIVANFIQVSQDIY